MGSILFLAFAGGLGGLAGWALIEPFAPELADPHWSRWEILFALTLGGLIGLVLGASIGWMQGSRLHALRGALGGLVLGAVGGYVGLLIGAGMAHMIFGPKVFGDPKNPFDTGAPLPVKMLARMVVFAPFGALIGVVQGVGTRSGRRAFLGLLGGLLGGAAGGAFFDPVGQIVGPIVLQAKDLTVGEVGAASRAIASTITGAAVGFFIGLVDLVARQAWLRLELGRNEGREWVVDAPKTFIGRSENAHVPLYGDPNIAPMHACVFREGGVYRLLDGGAPIGIGVNGIRVPEAILRHGDIINIGSYTLRFLLKQAHRVTAFQQDAAHQASPVAMPLPPHPSDAPTEPPLNSFWLVALEGPNSGQRFPLSRGEVIVGRETSAVPLSYDTGVSRRHAAFSVDTHTVSVRDLNSTNGTFVNGIRVQEMALRRGDTIRMGNSTFRLE